MIVGDDIYMIEMCTECNAAVGESKAIDIVTTRSGITAKIYSAR